MRIYNKYTGKNLNNITNKYSTGGIIGDTLSGVGSGAGIGASIGMIGGPPGAGLGALIGGGVGLVGGLFSGLSKDSAENKAEAIRKRNEYLKQESLNATNDQLRMSQYNEEGYGMRSLYANGGKINNTLDINNYQINNDNYINSQSDDLMSDISNPNIINPFTNIYQEDNITSLPISRQLGGTINQVDPNTKINRVGAGIQVKTNKKGTDKINANIEGSNIKLDNNEVIVDYNGEPVVISDDLGEVNNYKKELFNGKNPIEVKNKYAERAIAKQDNTDINFVNGGGIYGDEPPGTLNWFNSINNTTNENAQKGSYDWYINQPNDYNQIELPLDKISSIAGIPSPNENSFNLTNGQISGIAQGASFLGNTISNIDAANKLNKINYPTPNFNTFIPRNLDVNKELYEKAKSDVYKSTNELESKIKSNTSSSNVALSRIGEVQGKKLDSLSDISTKQAVDRARIAEANVSDINKVAFENIALSNQDDLNQYRDRIGKIQTGLALKGSTLAGLDKITTNLRQDKYQKEYLQAIAKQIGLGQLDDMSIDSIYNSLDNTRKKELLQMVKDLKNNKNK